MNTIKYELEVKVADLKPVQDLIDMFGTAVKLLRCVTPHTQTIGQSWFDHRESLLLKVDKIMDALTEEDE